MLFIWRVFFPQKTKNLIFWIWKSKSQWQLNGQHNNQSQQQPNYQLQWSVVADTVIGHNDFKTSNIVCVALVTIIYRQKEEDLLLYFLIQKIGYIFFPYIISILISRKIIMFFFLFQILLWYVWLMNSFTMNSFTCFGLADNYLITNIFRLKTGNSTEKFIAGKLNWYIRLGRKKQETLIIKYFQYYYILVTWLITQNVFHFIHI